MIIGLTGGIGSGKSTVAKLLELMGCAIFDSDRAAKEVYLQEEVKQKVIALLGKECYSAEGSLNRGFVSEKVFKDTLLLHQLNHIIHPAVRLQMQDFVSSHAGRMVVKETALLFEAHLEKEVDVIIVVTAPDALRIKRVMQRDGISEAEVVLRIKKQLPQEEKVAKAHYVIHNNDEEMVIPQVLEILNKIRV